LLGDNKENLSIREDFSKGIYIENLTEESAKNSDEAINLLIKGARYRHTAPTFMNFESSRFD